MSMALAKDTAQACSVSLRAEHPGDFVETAARLAGAVSIVAGRDETGPFGLVVSSLTILSIEPPRLLFCIRKAASIYDRLLAAQALSLTVLAAEDEAEATAFTVRNGLASRFCSDRWNLHPTRPPRFDGGLAAFEGDVFQKISAASHTIFILNVEHSQHEEADPLLYFNRRYRRLASADHGPHS